MGKKLRNTSVSASKRGQTTATFSGQNTATYSGQNTASYSVSCLPRFLDIPNMV